MDDNTFNCITIIFVIVLVIAAIAFEVWVNVTYGNLPISEVPSWAIRFILG